MVGALGANNVSIKVEFYLLWKQFSMLDNKHIKLSSSLYHRPLSKEDEVGQGKQPTATVMRKLRKNFC